uniref:Uncharacterized protein n=1 Tax=Odontella aurita TaxID=265563 RepID=A0A7S4K7D1_9STRA|mmetsp:Transcript_63239/g.187007  ORF Transcript_63239/g.187007 Transcript_63239/m.187007 type:complete len:131 (+) Transcript_63239:459-851(+)
MSIFNLLTQINMRHGWEKSANNQGHLFKKNGLRCMFQLSTLSFSSFSKRFSMLMTLISPENCQTCLDHSLCTKDPMHQTNTCVQWKIERCENCQTIQNNPCEMTNNCRNDMHIQCKQEARLTFLVRKQTK